MSKHLEILESTDRVSLTPMIDIVFLLLAYFMVTTAIQKEEGDLGIQLPVPNEAPTQDNKKPDEAVITVLPSAEIEINGDPVDHYESREMPQLTEVLRRLKGVAAARGVPIVVTIQAHDESPHQRSIDALNACAAAGVSMVTFGQGEG